MPTAGSLPTDGRCPSTKLHALLQGGRIVTPDGCCRTEAGSVILFGGIIKGTFYGLLIAIAGCLRGFQCRNSSSAVGDAATQAVVMAIVMIVVACGLFAVVFNFLGI
jgi:hypothetical protein